MASTKNQFFMETSVCLLTILFLFQVMYSAVPSYQVHEQHLRLFKPAGSVVSSHKWWEDLTYGNYAVFSLTRCSQGNLVSVGALNWVIVLERNVPLEPPPLFC
ncbi:hypothetical protein [Geoalkalibacter halelectricus]|uniref:hypothetical protein n=1 Tax=Geoalkalibacter halelectricus TaxID=2847045 RepID=UPI003D23683C